MTAPTDQEGETQQEVAGEEESAGNSARQEAEDNSNVTTVECVIVVDNTVRTLCNILHIFHNNFGVNIIITDSFLF